MLKRGVYKPVRKYSSKTIAALSTFIVSGILHEYILWLLSLPESSNTDSPVAYPVYKQSFGNQFSFFAWNGMLMLLEYILINQTMTAQMKLSVPPIIKSMLVILMALPVSHWFTDEYIRSGVFSHYAVGFPIIARLE